MFAIECPDMCVMPRVHVCGSYRENTISVMYQVHLLSSRFGILQFSAGRASRPTPRLHPSMMSLLSAPAPPQLAAVADDSVHERHLVVADSTLALGKKASYPAVIISWVQY